MPEDPLSDLSVQYNSNLNSEARVVELLNHSDPEELRRHWQSLPSDAARWIRTGTNKIEAYPEKFGRPLDHYDALLGIVALSSWPNARKFCMCGILNHRRVRQPCYLWNLCPACSYGQRKRQTLAAYLTRFHRTSWHLVTISYEGGLGDGNFDGDTVRLRWLAAAHALRRCQRPGYFRGLMTRFELHLERFLPLEYFPHVHAIVDADEIDRELIANQVFAYRCPETGNRIACPLSVHHRPLRTEKAFANALSYVNKALNLVKVYRDAWPHAVQNDRQGAVRLHMEVSEYLDAMSYFTEYFHQVRYSGTMHWRSGRSLRLSRDDRDAQRDAVAAILVENNLDPWDDGDHEPATVFPPPGINN